MFDFVVSFYEGEIKIWPAGECINAFSELMI